MGTKLGTKRSKKAKQPQQETYLEENDVIPKNEPLIEMDVDVENNVRKASRKKKREEHEEEPKKAKRTGEVSDAEPKKKKKKRSVNNVEIEEPEPPINENLDHKTTEEIAPTERRHEEINWPEQDLTLLLNRMEQLIPEADSLLYTTRVEKLDWSKIIFKDYSIEDCKNTWYLLLKKIRRFRILSEVLADAKDWVLNPKISQRSAGRAKKHPDMPRRPLTSYLLFYLKKKDQIISENPGLEGSDITKLIGQIYKTLPPEKRAKYEKLAASNKEEYVEKLKVFFDKHPELMPPAKNHTTHKAADKDKEVEDVEKIAKPIKEKPVKVEKPEKREKAKPGRPAKAVKIEKPEKDRPPKQNQTAFGLYFQSELNNNPGVEKGTFREKCKEQWKQLSDKKKLTWITLAEEDLSRYQTEVSEYKSKHPDFDANKAKAAITKFEKSLKERLAGKPIKPPNSAYGLYSKLVLQSEEIKVIHPKDRMNFIANKWKNITELERNKYKDQALILMEKYKTDYNSYLESLPEDQRKLEEQPVIPKRKNNGRKPKVVKKEPAAKFKEPEQPPISPSKYFATVYTGTGEPLKVWKSLSSEEKRKYEEELTKKKQAYIVEFERFLKSLTIEELEAFRKSRQLQTKSDDDESTCSSDSEDEDDENDDDDEDNESDSE